MESKSKEDSINAQSKTFIVEHLDPDLESWSSLEYAAIAAECHDPKYTSHFVLSSVPKTLQLPPELRNMAGLTIEHRSVEELYNGRKERVCLLDPKAEEELSPSDGNCFDAFLFGGILGIFYHHVVPDLAVDMDVNSLQEMTHHATERPSFERKGSRPDVWDPYR